MTLDGAVVVAEAVVTVGASGVVMDMAVVNRQHRQFKIKLNFPH
ncbi:hypothetical protein [Salmonella enterica]|nr:hypothetical protein [Salmonella enterica]